MKEYVAFGLSDNMLPDEVDEIINDGEVVGKPSSPGSVIVELLRYKDRYFLRVDRRLISLNNIAAYIATPENPDILWINEDGCTHTKYADDYTTRDTLDAIGKMIIEMNHRLRKLEGEE